MSSPTPSPRVCGAAFGTDDSAAQARSGLSVMHLHLKIVPSMIIGWQLGHCRQSQGWEQKLFQTPLAHLCGHELWESWEEAAAAVQTGDDGGQEQGRGNGGEKGQVRR